MQSDKTSDSDGFNTYARAQLTMGSAKDDGFVWPSGKELEVLRLLKGEPRGMYGLEIVDRSGGTVGRTSVYVLLARLEEKGFVRVRRTTSRHPGMPRPIYSITGSGQRAIAAFEVATMSRARA
jgi:DNA-binding PadR family transcriptional regulator